MTITQTSNWSKIGRELGHAVGAAVLLAAATFFTKNVEVLGPYTAVVVLAIRQIDNQFFA